MKHFIQVRFLKFSAHLHNHSLSKGLLRHGLIICSLLSSLFYQVSALSKPFQTSQAGPVSHAIEHQTQRINLQQPLKHCVKKIEIKKQFLYMTDDWYSSAKQDAKRLWQQSVIKRFGSVYGQWEIAQNKKYDCKRIGFGNDDEGNIGASVVCQIAADPCVILLNK